MIKKPWPIFIDYFNAPKSVPRMTLQLYKGTTKHCLEVASSLWDTSEKTPSMLSNLPVGRLCAMISFLFCVTFHCEYHLHGIDTDKANGNDGISV